MDQKLKKAKELQGFREPTSEEIKIINFSMEKYFTVQKGLYKNGMIFMLVIALFLFIAIENKSDGSIIFLLLFFIVFFAGAFVILKSSKKQHQKKEYQVLDCTIVGVGECTSDGVYYGEAIYNSLGKYVTIKTINDEYCTGFYLDGDSIKKFLDGNKVDLWLIKIGKNYDYQLISKDNID